MTKRDDDAQRSWEQEYPCNAMLHRLSQSDAENVKAGYLEGYRVAKEDSANAIRSREKEALEALAQLDEYRSIVNAAAACLNREGDNMTEHAYHELDSILNDTPS